MRLWQQGSPGKATGWKGSISCPFLFASFGGGCTSAKHLPPGCSSAFLAAAESHVRDFHYLQNQPQKPASPPHRGRAPGWRALSLSSGTSLSVPSNLLRGVPLFLKLLIVNNSDAFFSNSHVELHGENEWVWHCHPMCIWVRPPFVTLLGLYFLKQGSHLPHNVTGSFQLCLYFDITWQAFRKEYTYLDSHSRDSDVTKPNMV